MSLLEFAYRREIGATGWVYRPVASVVLENGAARIEALMYVDSGADISTIPLAAGEALGFTRAASDRLLRMRGVTGSPLEYVLKRVRFLFGNQRVPARVAWVLNDRVPFLLGRMDVFPLFDITFQERRKRVIFRRRGASRC